MYQQSEFLFLVTDINKDIKKDIDLLVNEGYTTVFVFRNANLQIMREELVGLSSDVFIFLHNIINCIISTKYLSKEYDMLRTSANGIEKLRIIDTQ